ncbi:5-dehydro-4-deoxy-D-glucuronate isomerase [Alicyclobacillus fastidiosus]|uniref:4-deoxy-L-threo-5-hexosulose-uronate ketol-isomerase n=1 Tax=Alicyclobacillus fastidiosus TaxID=392011 RepID=A0ABY6ZM20_9BACL|nr:5-dehydro-4-deoxy-D-glucuronate isomerase [Alicyclobacillus fastidiosus]WAH43939.1 5-dehydro-4-deoxy-D-glucuronate isomerase [Alicyclobacillus fastidiosus]GMA60194.1 4-deoxy-L-threo-5-hexosulose-uronate ketol-isomerase [Alicyclobacillus fastidiosus]
MEIRYTTNPTDFSQYGTKRIRDEFLITNLFQVGKVRTVYSHNDRVVLGGAVPTTEPLTLKAHEALKTSYFLERRELGIVNIGNNGVVSVDGESYDLDTGSCLYVGLGNKYIQFESVNEEEPAKFYIVSTTAHCTYPTTKVDITTAQAYELGTTEESNQRILYRFIHAEGVKSCQLMLGMTVLKPNNMWNTMPAHTHDRRMEAYLYFGLPEDSKVFHFMGKPDETRHLVVSNEEAVISPSWSIHSGVGTHNYTFIWAMAGENYTFEDMDAVKMEDLR